MFFNKAEEELKIEAGKKAEKYYKKGQFLCSEAVLLAINEVYELGMPEEYVKMASGFPVGMGSAGCSCGALTGGQMALGLAFGRTKKKEDNKKAMELSKELHDKFREKYKTACCRILIKDVKDKPREHFKQCTEITKATTELVGAIIDENR